MPILNTHICMNNVNVNSDDDVDAPIPSKHQRKNANAKTAGLKAELKHLLAQPLIARGVSTRYITSGSRPIVDDMIKGECAYSFLLLAIILCSTALLAQVAALPCLSLIAPLPHG